jgi:LCP family protein required for cell wall assembly
MQKKRKTLLIAGGAILVVVIVAAAVVAYGGKAMQRWSAPLGPGLGLPTQTPTALQPTATESELASLPDLTPTTRASAAGTQTVVLPTATIKPTATPAPLCGGPPVMTILGMGVDGELDYRYGLSDVIRVMRVDFVTPKVTMLSIPRDLWVEIPGISDHYGLTHGKLNQAYFYGSPGMGYYDGPGGGPGLLARTLDLNFGLRVDHYGAVNMQTFVKIVNAVGGIDVYLPNDVDGTPIDDKTEDMGYFEAGNHHFTGDMALRFSRIRKRYNDFTRADNQNLVICALKEKLTSPTVLPKIPQIISSFQGSVLTDLSPQQLAQLACLVPKLRSENLIFTGLPEEILKPGRVNSPQQGDSTYILEADFDVIRDYVSQFMAGTWPTEPDEPTCP